MPKAYFRFPETSPDLKAWALIAENNHYAIYVKDGSSATRTPYSHVDMNEFGYTRTLGILFYFFCLFQMIARNVVVPGGMGVANAIVLISATLIGIAIVWTRSIEFYEIKYFEQHQLLFPLSAVRYKVSITLLIAVNLVPVLCVISLLYQLSR